MNIVELDWNIALNSDYTSLTRLCQSSTQFRNICQDVLFWKQKYLRDFGLPQGFNINELHDWNRLYQLQVKVFPKIQKYIDGLEDFRRRNVLDYIERVRNKVLDNGNYIAIQRGIELYNIYYEKFKFDKIIIAEINFGYNTLAMFAHSTINNTEVMCRVNTDISSPGLHPAQIVNIDYYPGLKQSLYRDIVVDYEWKLNIEGIEYRNLYILNPDEFLLFSM